MSVRRTPPAILQDVAFFAVFLAYVWAGIDTRLILHWQGTTFYATSAYLAGFLKYPGGLIDYGAAFLSQVYAGALEGAALLTAEAAVATALTAALLARRSLMRFLPALLLLFCVNLYYDRRPLALHLIVGLAAALLTRRVPAAWIPVLALTYYVGGPAVVFFAPVAIIALQHRIRIAVAILAFVLPVMVHRLHVTYIPIPLRAWFVDPDFRLLAARSALYLFFPLALLWTRVRHRAAAATPAPSGSAERHATATSRPLAAPGSRRPLLRFVVESAGILLALAAVAGGSHRANGRDRRLAAIDYFTFHEDWPAVVEAARGLHSDEFNSLTRYQLDLALHETHRLGDEMFRFPHAGPPFPPLRGSPFLPYSLAIADLCLRLGRLNDAEHFAGEAVVLAPGDARPYRLMADIAFAKGQPAVARKFLNVLSDAPLHRRWAETRPAARAAVLHTRTLLRDDVIAVWQRADKPEADMERLLLDQLEQDPANRLAFEFLMGAYLASRDMVGIAALMPRRPRDGSGTPRHYQEAMAMYADMMGTPLDIAGLEIEPDTLNRMAVFKRIVALGPTREAAMQAAWARFHDTYFFFFVFGPGDYR
jgi:hypothetical protein